MQEIISISKMKYGWSRYGGPNHGLVKEELPEWYCQGCGKLQAKGLPSYMLPMMDLRDRDFVRVCSQCENLLWETKTKRIFTRLHELLRLQTHGLF